MGKREEVKKERKPRDYYATVDPDAVKALEPFLYRAGGVTTRYVEPCAGAGSLINLMASEGLPVECVGAYDIDPQAGGITQRNCLTLSKGDVHKAHCFITNPPFHWDMLKPILDHLPTVLPTWLLLPADLAHNKRVSPYMDFCTDLVSVGRLWWFPDENGKLVKGVDNMSWYRFCAAHEGFTKFHARQT